MNEFTVDQYNKAIEALELAKEQFQRMGDLYEKALLEKDKEISRLKQRVNKLEQRHE